MRKLSCIVVMLCVTLLVHPGSRAVAGSAPVVISEVYPGGGNTGAIYANDFVELFNRTGSVVSFTGWSIGYSSKTSNTWKSVPLRGSINPYHYFLVKMGTGGGGGTTTLPAPDVTGSINIARTGAKVRLYNGSSTVDLLGFGSGVNAYEGKPIAAPSDNKHSMIRINAGCTDNNVNATDFKILTPGPRNKASHGFECPGGGTTTNRAPVLASIGAKSVDANKALTFTVSASDPDRDALSYKASPLPSGARFTPSTRTFEWVPTAEHIGTHRVNFSVSDGKLSDSETVTITVRPDPYQGPSEITLVVTKEVNRLVASGTVSPPQPGSLVTAKLFRYESGTWVRKGFGRVPLDTRSAYRVAFPNQLPGRCLVTAAFQGNNEYPAAHAQQEVRC